MQTRTANETNARVRRLQCERQVRGGWSATDAFDDARKMFAAQKAGNDANGFGECRD